MSVWKFQGVYDEQGRPDRYLLGVPARDLTEEDYAALRPDEQRLVEETGLYRRVGARKADAPADEGEAVTEDKEVDDASG